MKNRIIPSGTRSPLKPSINRSHATRDGQCGNDAAAMGKVGVLFIPVLLGWGGVEWALVISIAVQLIGAAVTAIYGREVLPEK